MRSRTDNNYFVAMESGLIAKAILRTSIYLVCLVIQSLVRLDRSVIDGVEGAVLHHTYSLSYSLGQSDFCQNRTEDIGVQSMHL